MTRPKGSKNKPKQSPSTPSDQRAQTPLISIGDLTGGSQTPSMPPSTQPLSSQSAKKKKLPDFDRDGPPSSQELILQYFEDDEDNIKRFYLGKSGKSTIVMAGELSRYIVDNGGLYERSADSIVGKVNAWKRQWREARDYMNQTGAGGGARRLAEAEDMDEDESFQVQVEVEAEKLTLCPLWHRLDPIFHESEGGDPALIGDSAQDSNPTLLALERGLEAINSTSNNRNNSATASTDVPSTPTPSSARATGGNRAVVKSTSWNNFGDDSQSDISSIASSRKRQGSIERMLEKDQEYRDWKRSRLEKTEESQRELNETAKSEKIFNMAEITKRNNPEMSCNECIELAETYIERRIGRNRIEGM